VKTNKTGSAGNKYPAHPVFLSRPGAGPDPIQRVGAEIISASNLTGNIPPISSKFQIISPQTEKRCAEMVRIF
jgi:hypothetical protein